MLFDAQQTTLQQVRAAFMQLEEEDPQLQVQWEPQLGELRVRVMGRIQLEILSELVPQRFGFQAAFGPCEVLYKETIASSAMGFGHFEPLRHYAEVHLLLSPGAPGSGIAFASACPIRSAAAKRTATGAYARAGEATRGLLTGRR